MRIGRSRWDREGGLEDGVCWLALRYWLVLRWMELISCLVMVLTGKYSIWNAIKRFTISLFII